MDRANESACPQERDRCSEGVSRLLVGSGEFGLLIPSRAVKGKKVGRTTLKAIIAVADGRDESAAPRKRNMSAESVIGIAGCQLRLLAPSGAIEKENISATSGSPHKGTIP